MPNGEENCGYHFFLESDNFSEDYQRLKQAGIPIQTEPHPAGAREPGEKDWLRAVLIGPDGESVEIRG